MTKATSADRKKPPLKLQDGGYYWVAIDDGSEFNVRDFLGEGPHLVRLDRRDGEWSAAILNRFGCIVQIGSDPTKRVGRMSWQLNGLMGATSDAQEVRITWLAKLGKPPALPGTIEPVDAVTTVWAR